MAPRRKQGQGGRGWYDGRSASDWAGPDWTCKECEFKNRHWREECLGCQRGAAKSPLAATAKAMAKSYAEVIKDLANRDPAAAEHLSKLAVVGVREESTKPISVQLQEAERIVEQKKGVVHRANEKLVLLKEEMAKAEDAIRQQEVFIQEAAARLADWTAKLEDIRGKAPSTEGVTAIRQYCPGFTDADAQSAEGQQLAEMLSKFQASFTAQIAAFSDKRRVAQVDSEALASKAAAATVTEGGVAAPTPVGVEACAADEGMAPADDFSDDELDDFLGCLGDECEDKEEVEKREAKRKALAAKLKALAVRSASAKKTPSRVRNAAAKLDKRPPAAAQPKAGSK